MRAQIVNPFIKAGVGVFEKLSKQTVSLGTPTKSDYLFPHFNMASVIKIIGKVDGYVIYSMDNYIAHKFTSDLLYGMPITSESSLVKSAINEICNMVCGHAVSLLENENKSSDFSISVPVFLPDTDSSIYKKSVVALNIPLRTPYGVVILSVGFETDKLQDEK